MQFLFLDYETYYDDEYSLRKLAPPNYILDGRCEIIGCAVKTLDGEPSRWVDGPDFPAFIAAQDPADTTTVCFNAMFDNAILAWRYGFVPARMVCTMRMASALQGHELKGQSLAAVAQHLGIGTKGTEIQNAKGKHRADLMSDPEVWRAYKAYANNDNELNAAIMGALWGQFPEAERRTLDMVLRCAIEPKFHIDVGMLRQHLEELRDDKARVLEQAGIKDQSELRSADKFEELLRQQGVDIEYKRSHTDASKMIPQFAKTDKFMADLAEDPNPTVQALAAARLGARSTIEETRGGRMLSIAELPWPSGQPLLPVPLRYSAAHTHRLGGDWKLNMQNLPSGRGGRLTKLRKALIAPPGHMVVVADKSQIECRLNAHVCGQDDLLEVFRTGGDPYARLATLIFGREINKTEHPVERFIGKTGVLGLGYGCGAPKFYNMVIQQGRNLNLDMSALLSIWTEELAKRSVDVYRGQNRAIVKAWKTLDWHLKQSWTGWDGPRYWAPEKFGPCEIGHGYVQGPGGLAMRFWPDSQESDGTHRYRYGRHTHKIYGAKFLENIIQYFARINTMHDALRIADRGFRFVLQSHDELVWIVPEDQVDECRRVALEEMRRVPSWAPGLPLDAECSFGRSYGDAK